nr:hypothetical protein [Tanacetum cinerariifolium]
MTTTVVNNSLFRTFFDKQKLTGNNFMEWYRNLRIVLSVEDKLPFLEQPIPAMPFPPAGQVLPLDVLNTHTAWVKAQKEIVGIMLMTMDPDIQNNLEHLDAFDMLKELKMLKNPEKTKRKNCIRLLRGIKGKAKQRWAMHLCQRHLLLPNLRILQHPRRIIQRRTRSATNVGLRGSRKLKPGALSLYMGDGHRVAVEAIGEFHLCLPGGLLLILHNCHYALFITRSIILVSHLYKDGFVNRFENDNSISVSRNNLIYFNAIPRDDIYEIVLSSPNTNDSSMYAISNKRAKLNLDSALLWYFCLGHISKKRIEKLQHDGLLGSTNIKSFEKYVSCMSGKMARKAYLHQVERATDLLGLIHTDVYVFKKEVENQLGKTIKSLCFVCGGEYMSQEFLDHLKRHGIIAHRTPPYTPQHNGVSEKRNRTLLDMVRSMMSQTTLPKSFWDYVLEFAARILNMVLTKKVDKTPYEDTQKTMRYSFYYPPENKVFVARNAEFLKNSLRDQEASGSLEDLEIIREEDTHPSLDTSLNHKEDDQEIDEPQSDINPIHRYTRTRRPTYRLCLYVDAEEHELGDHDEPANYKAALLDPESDKWLNAMNVKMQSVKDNKVWELVDLHSNCKIVGHKWLFKKKTNIDGAVHTYKARLVAKGFTQTPRIDYKETFSPIAYIRAIRMLIAITAFYDYEIWKMDVKTAFLNGYLKDVYMEKPEGFVNHKFPNRNITSRFQQNPGEVHWSAVKNILKYLHNTKDMFLVYGGDTKRELRKSTKQSIFATSSTDAKYIAAFDASKEAVWIRKFISGLSVVPTIEELINMYYDNTGAIAIVKDHGVTKGARHFLRKSSLSLRNHRNG